jgi:hypothetical protein
LAAEAVASRDFQAAVDALDEGKRTEVEWAIYAIEDDPAWGAAPDRFIAPADPPFSGFIIDFSVEGYGIVYRIVDHGAAVELWYRFPMPGPPRRDRGRPSASPPMM